MLFGLIRYELRRLKKRIGVSAPLKRRKFFYISEQLEFSKDFEYAKAKIRDSNGVSSYGVFK